MISLSQKQKITNNLSYGVRKRFRKNLSRMRFLNIYFT
jgi:hypothetical protein